MTMLKPTWQNMKGSGNRTPVEEIVGQCYDWNLVASQFGGNNVIFKFNQCQVLKSDVPFPYAEWDLQIKYSDSANSGWGIFGTSMAAALSIDIELLDPDLLKGRWVHLLRSEKEYGDDQNNPGQKIKGMVWNIIGFVQPGQPVQSVAPATPSPLVSSPVAQVAAAAAPVVVAAPNGQAEVAAPVVATPVVTAPAVGSVTPEQQAMNLLNGKNTADFFQAAVPDPIIRGDAALVNSILSNAFITAKVAAGLVARNEDGTHTVLPQTVVV